MALLTVEDQRPSHPDAARYTSALEVGDVLYFEDLKPGLSADDIAWLLSTRADGSGLHKNVSYRPGQNLVRGYANKSDAERLRLVMQQYSEWAVEFLGNFLTPYSEKWALDYASFRPIEENGRELPLHKRNELLHVDAFPSRPTFGGRILRFFSNINPNEKRVWQVGGGFDELAEKHADAAGLGSIGDGPSIGERLMMSTGILPKRSGYDRFMLRFHDHLKEDGEYQAKTEKHLMEFRPNSSWAVYTDGVPHSVLSGRFALEQTFIVPFDALVRPEVSPLRILEGLSGTQLTS